MAGREQKSKGISRRALLTAATALPLASILGPRPHPSVIVVGAGAFGGWTALHLARSGARVTLLDAWGPGNSRASSGGETRVIRAVYPDRVYVEMATRALRLWQENERIWNHKLYFRTGLIRMAGQDDDFEKAAVALFRDAGIEFEQLTAATAARRYPQINFDGVNWVVYENNAGRVMARRACEAVLNAFLHAGGQYRQAAVQPPVVTGPIKGITLGDGSTLIADKYVFACGPWLGTLFPDAIGRLITPSRQEVFFFGTPAGDSRFTEKSLPIWSDRVKEFYGIPGNEWRGFKVASHRHGPPFDPTNSNRIASAEALEAARDFLGLRFPELKGAPLLESRVCQYENTPDEHFIIDRHPHAENLWLVGGGSGHGFKHGPAVGERVSELVLDKRAIDPFFSLSRFKNRVQ
ncbi:MAG TPA: FAD-dependent oxidoreductase [Acidobacteriota bacterium]